MFSPQPLSIYALRMRPRGELNAAPASRRDQEVVFLRVSDRIRTGDRLDHNQELYQLSYAHHAATESNSAVGLRALNRRDGAP